MESRRILRQRAQHLFIRRPHDLIHFARELHTRALAVAAETLMNNAA
jgi:hypothetical protein